MWIGEDFETLRVELSQIDSCLKKLFDVPLILIESFKVIFERLLQPLFTKNRYGLNPAGPELLRRPAWRIYHCMLPAPRTTGLQHRGRRDDQPLHFARLKFREAARIGAA